MPILVHIQAVLFRGFNNYLQLVDYPRKLALSEFSAQSVYIQYPVLIIDMPIIGL